MLHYGDGNSTRYYTAPHGAALDLSASTGWAFGLFIRITDNAGTALQYALNTRAVGNGRVAIYVVEANGTGGNVNTVNAAIQDDAGGSTALNNNSATVADGKLRLVVLQYGASLAELYTCIPGGAAVLAQSSTPTLTNVTPIENWHFGTRNDLNVDRFWESDFGGFFKSNRVLSPGEIAAIAAGAAPPLVLGSAAAGWLDFCEPTAVVKDLIGPNNATQNGASWPAAAEHYPLRLGGAIYIRPPAPATMLGAIPPDFLLASTNLTGAYTDVDDDPASPDANKLAATDPIAATSALLRFSAPAAGATLAGTQSFETLLSKTAGSANPTVDVELWEHDGAGSLDLDTSFDFVATVTDNLAITSTSGQVDTHEFDSAVLTDPTRQLAVRIVSTVGVG